MDFKKGVSLKATAVVGCRNGQSLFIPKALPELHAAFGGGQRWHEDLDSAASQAAAGGDAAHAFIAHECL